MPPWYTPSVVLHSPTSLPAVGPRATFIGVKSEIRGLVWMRVHCGDSLHHESASSWSFSALSSRFSLSTPHGLHVLQDGLELEVLRQEIGRVLVGPNLAHGDLFTANLLLYPEILRGDVARLAEASAVDDAQGGRRVRIDLGFQLMPKVHEHRQEPRALGRGLDQRVELRLARRQGYHWLSTGPTLY